MCAGEYETARRACRRLDEMRDNLRTPATESWMCTVPTCSSNLGSGSATDGRHGCEVSSDACDGSQNGFPIIKTSIELGDSQFL